MHLKQDNDNSITKSLLTCGKSSYQIGFQSFAFMVKIVKIFQFNNLVSIATNPWVAY
jgi:hypothetical protein